jgi:hypothetical protein
VDIGGFAHLEIAPDKNFKEVLNIVLNVAFKAAHARLVRVAAW